MTEDITTIQQNSYPISNTHLTEFTKRKNWLDRIINELKDFYHVITPSGKFIYCSPVCQELVGYLPEEMVGRNLKEFIHIDDVDTFLRDFNLALKQQEYRLFLRLRCKDDKYSMFEITGHPYFHERTKELKGFFSIGRLYPARTTSTMDSFLELRMENENLRRKLRNLGLEGSELASYHTENRIGPNTLGSSSMHSPEGQSDSISEPISPNVSTDLMESEVISRPKRKQKKNKTPVIRERVCTDCGTVDSPEWRKGPQGPKTLCNACGLRWTKQNRQARQHEVEQ